MKRFLSVSFVVLGALMVLVLAGCDDLFLEEEFISSTVTGSVVNALAAGSEDEYWKSGAETLSGAVVRFYRKQANGLYSSTPAYTTTVGSTGQFRRTDVTGGQYKLQGLQAGWSFVPMEVTVAGKTMKAPPMIAYRNESVYSLTILLEWQDETIDLDAYLTYYTGSGNSRGTISFTSRSANSGGLQMELHRDVQALPATATGIPRVETITVRAPDPTADWFDYLGESEIAGEDVPNDELRFYVNNFTRSDASLTGIDGTDSDKKSASARVHLMLNQGGNDPDEHYGTWVLPWNTGENTLQVFSVIPGDDPGTFTIFTQTRWVDDVNPGIRSLSLGPDAAVDQIR
ncbi:hypothetical protein AU468_12315 [Alkalispirochaeta sphaeroplastigenens]|uniref:Uncharacterized protein n=1 Tax=Alkalispirochaeta sphaeroplastigenens TaxID=1187066 RepID=A0A2S4JGX7_9SPIO|nr:hypothetical protein [Alkalispirochaeta sphaeroplastigenens]POQ98817.1 hypothetical protein AU468_12315 [Alkalispirochaeta sphaeroplastigenens]